MIADALEVAIEAGPTVAADEPAPGAEGAVAGAADPKERRALSTAVCACRIATVSIAAPTPPAAAIANPAEVSAETAPEIFAEACASRPKDAPSDTLAPTCTPAEIPIPAPAERLELKSIEAPACSDSELLAPICAAIPRHAVGSSPIRAANSAADSPARAMALLLAGPAPELPGPVPGAPGAVALPG